MEKGTQSPGKDQRQSAARKTNQMADPFSSSRTSSSEPLGGFLIHPLSDRKSGSPLGVCVTLGGGQPRWERQSVPTSVVGSRCKFFFINISPSQLLRGCLDHVCIPPRFHECAVPRAIIIHDTCYVAGAIMRSDPWTGLQKPHQILVLETFSKGGAKHSHHCRICKRHDWPGVC